jgi:predicted nuclease with TOPRIM domain
MPEATPTERIRILEQRVAGLESLPGRVTAVERQIVQLREEMRDGFSAIRQEMTSEVGGLRGEFGELRGEFGELRGEFGELRGEFGELRGEFGELRGEFGKLRGEFGELRGEVDELRGEVDELRDKVDKVRGELRAEIRAGDEETRRFMRVLHEEVIARIAAIGEGGRRT